MRRAGGKVPNGTAQGVTPAQLREAERGIRLMLAKKFSAVWIAENARDVLGQANIEYAEWLEGNPPARNPVGWLLNCAYWRALNLLDAETRKPPEASLDAVFHLADESTPTPEQQAIDKDRQERLRKMLAYLPDKECKLLALVYFEEHSISEAGRKIGWQKSAATRHHNWAMEKLRALAGDDRSLLSPATLGFAAFIAARSRGSRLSRLLDTPLTPLREGIAIGTEGLTIGARRVGDMARTLSPFSEHGSAAASGGWGRAAGVCAGGLLTLACGLGAGGVIGPGLSDLGARPQEPTRSEPLRQASERQTQPPVPAPLITTPEVPAPEKPDQVLAPTAKAADRAQAKQQPAPVAPAPESTHRQVEADFGIGGRSGPASEPEPTPAPSPQRSEPSGSPASPRPDSSSSSGTPSASEFGL